MTDEAFSCLACAAKPALQTIQGCFVPVRKPNVILGFEFHRCPITYQCAAAFQLVRAYDDGFLTSSYEMRRTCPTKRLQAIKYIEFLRKLREAHEY